MQTSPKPCVEPTCEKPVLNTLTAAVDRAGPRAHSERSWAGNLAPNSPSTHLLTFQPGKFTSLKPVESTAAS